MKRLDPSRARWEHYRERHGWNLRLTESEVFLIRSRCENSEQVKLSEFSEMNGQQWTPLLQRCIDVVGAEQNILTVRHAAT